VEVSRFDAMLAEQLQNHDFQLVEQLDSGHYTRFEIVIPQTKNNNDLLQLFLQYSDIHSFNEILPTMNEIFIEQVEQSNQTQNHEK
jgi:ABC-2 type transport system ATP-binding protein